MTLVLIAATGCDCEVYGDGVVVDSTTNLPLDSVIVIQTGTANATSITDSTGSFSYFDRVNGINKCAEVDLTFIREGFDTLFIPGGELTIDTIIVELTPR